MSPLAIFVVACMILAAARAVSKALLWAIIGLIVFGAIFRPYETFALALCAYIDQFMAPHPWLTMLCWGLALALRWVADEGGLDKEGQSFGQNSSQMLPGPSLGVP